MRIEAVTLNGIDGSPALRWNDVHPGLNAVYGPLQSVKYAVTELLAHVLFGQSPSERQPTARREFATSEVVVQRGQRRYRLRRHYDGMSAAKLTVAGLNGSPADGGTMHDLVGGLSPHVLSPLCAIDFSAPPHLDRLLSAEFAREFQALGGPRPTYGGRRMAELAARRDLLAQELETRIAGERRVSMELDGRWRELDRLVRDEQQRATSCEQRFRAVEAALAETDARLRYRRLELNAQLRWHAEEPDDGAAPLAELDDQIASSRATLAELGQREAGVQARLAEIQASRGAAAAAVVDQRAWVSMARQLAADLAGEVARLARASASEQCVCRDAHPRLRPIAETVERQLDVLAALIDEQHAAVHAVELRQEVDTLSRTQGELRRYLENLLERRQILSRGVRPRRRTALNGRTATVDSDGNDAADDHTSLSAADAAQLEERRLELEQERFQLAEQLSAHQRALRDRRAQRVTVERQRAALLSARSIDHVQRELAEVQRKLEQAAEHLDQHEHPTIPAEIVSRASDFLAQLSDGGLVQIVLVDGGRRARVATRAGETLDAELLAESQRNLLYLSLDLALLSALAQRGVWLPLLLDEPFPGLDARSTAALAVVLDDFCRRGHQVLVFTSQAAAIERFHSVGAAVRDLESLRHPMEDAPPTRHPTSVHSDPPQTGAVSKRRGPRVASRIKRRKPVSRNKSNGQPPAVDHSDAA